MTILSILIVLAAGAVLLQWNDLFHVAVVLPILTSAVAVGRWLRSAGGVDGDVPADDEGEPLGVRMIRGVFVGAILLGVSAGGLLVTTHTPVYAWFYDRDLQRLIEKIEILESAGAYTEVVRLVDGRQKSKMSSASSAQLEERKIRALIHSAEQLQSDTRINALRAALQEANQTGSADLQELVEAKLHAVEKDSLLAQVRLAVEQSERGLLVRLPDVLFRSGEGNLIDSAQAQLEQIVELVNQPDNSNRRVSVEGHADGTGSDQSNQLLSDGRASSVATALTRMGVDASRITTRGFGSSRPVASNHTTEGRTKNRRVEIVVLKSRAQ